MVQKAWEDDRRAAARGGGGRSDLAGWEAVPWEVWNQAERCVAKSAAGGGNEKTG